jgi:hypothetical protein
MLDQELAAALAATAAMAQLVVMLWPVGMLLKLLCHCITMVV